MPRKLPSLNALAALEAAARHGSIARAAEELRVSPAAVSQHVRGLEEELGVLLFLRQARGIALTETARRLLPTLSECFDRLDEAAFAVREGRGRGRLVLSALPSFAAGWLVPRLAAFERSFPDVVLHVRAERRLVQFDRDEVDVAIRHARAAPPQLASQLLLEETAFPVCSPALAYGERPLREPSDLTRVPLLHDLDAEPRQRAIGWSAYFERHGLPLSPAQPGVWFDDSMVMLGAAVEGRGVAIGREPLVRELLARGVLVRPLRESWATEHSYFAVGTRRTFRRPLVRALLEWLSAQAVSKSA